MFLQQPMMIFILPYSRAEFNWLFCTIRRSFVAVLCLYAYFAWCLSIIAKVLWTKCLGIEQNNGNENTRAHVQPIHARYMEKENARTQSNGNNVAVFCLFIHLTGQPTEKRFNISFAINRCLLRSRCSFCINRTHIFVCVCVLLRFGSIHFNSWCGWFFSFYFRFSWWCRSVRDRNCLIEILIFRQHQTVSLLTTHLVSIVRALFIYSDLSNVTVCRFTASQSIRCNLQCDHLKNKANKRRKIARNPPTSKSTSNQAGIIAAVFVSKMHCIWYVHIEPFWCGHILGLSHSCLQLL